jgi:uncharacterized protein YegL
MSPTQIPLIRGPVSVPRLAAKKSQAPNVAVVYSTSDGKLEYLDRTIGFSESILPRFSYRYDVDTSDHECAVQVPEKTLPATLDAFYFEATLTVGFRVSDPIEIVRREIRDGLALVHDRLITLIRPIARRYDIERAAEAEDKINQTLATPQALAEGVLVYRAHVALAPDATARKYLRDRRGQVWNGALTVGTHEQQTNQAHHVQGLQDIKAHGELGRQRMRIEAVSALNLDERGLINVYIAQNPANAAHALELLRQRELTRDARDDERDKAHMALLEFLVENSMVRGPHLTAINDLLLGKMLAAGPSGSAATHPALALPSGPSARPQAPVPPPVPPGDTPRAVIPLAQPTPTVTPAAAAAVVTPVVRGSITVNPPSQPNVPVQPSGPARPAVPTAPASRPVTQAPPASRPVAPTLPVSRPPETSTPSTAMRLPHSATWVDHAPPVTQTPPDRTPPTQIPPAAQTPPAPTPPPMGQPGPVAQASAAGGSVQPVYLVIDASEAVTPWANGFGARLANLWLAVLNQPDVVAHLRLSVLTYADGARVHLPLTAIDPDIVVPRLSPGGEPTLAPALDELLRRIPDDIATLKASGHAINRPLVILIAVGPVSDGAEWPAARARLVDRDTHPSWPNIVAFALAGDDLTRHVATRPEFAFTARAGEDPATALTELWTALTDSLTTAGPSLGAGKGIVRITTPRGFRSALESP